MHHSEEVVKELARLDRRGDSVVPRPAFEVGVGIFWRRNHATLSVIAEMRLENRGRRQRIMENQMRRVAEPVLRHARNALQKIAGELLANFISRQSALQSDIEPEPGVRGALARGNNPTCRGVAFTIPLVILVTEKGTRHGDNVLEEERDLRIESKEQGNVAEGANGQESDFAGTGANGVTHKLDGRIGLTIESMRKVGDGLVLGCPGLSGAMGEGVRSSGHDGNIFAPGNPAENFRDSRAFVHITGHRGDTEQLRAWLPQEVCDGNRIVNIVAWIGIEENRNGVYPFIVSIGEKDMG